jgi:hypothetical protein
MNTDSLLHAWILPLLMVTGMPGHASGPAPSRIPRATSAAQVPDAGPQGLYVDTKGHDDNDDTVGNVMYNNQDQNVVHIAAIYVHGENIVTQGRFELNLDIQPGEKKQLLVIMRDKKGMKAKVSVDLHFQ